jgi:hypothetical protein
MMKCIHCIYSHRKQFRTCDCLCYCCFRYQLITGFCGRYWPLSRSSGFDLTCKSKSLAEEKILSIMMKIGGTEKAGLMQAYFFPLFVLDYKIIQNYIFSSYTILI